jgi:hypothetical protein
MYGVVAFRYYQQHYMVRDECVEDETWEEPVKQKSKERSLKGCW